MSSAYSEVAIRNNFAVLEYCRTSMVALSGCVAGILGLTGIYGALFYVFSIVSLWCMIWLKADYGHLHKYFISKKTVITNSFFGQIFTYILSWTFIYDFAVLLNQKSTYLTDRESFLTTNESRAPIASDLEQGFGVNLTHMLLANCRPSLQREFMPEMGATAPSGGALWCSPSDLLIGKLCLKPPFTQKHIQALTHTGILEIGAEIEAKLIAGFEKSKANIGADIECMVSKMLALKRDQLIETVRREEYEYRMQAIEQVRNEFEAKIVDLINCIGILIEQHEIELDEQKRQLHKQMLILIDEVTCNIIAIFLDKLKEQEVIMGTLFQLEISKMKKECKRTLKTDRLKCEKRLSHLRHTLRCQSIANLIFILCKERRKCHLEKELLVQNYEEQIRRLQKTLDICSKDLHDVKLELRRRQTRITTRETVLIEVLQQFQKFITFALQDVPPQDEFLLSLQRILQALSQSDAKDMVRDEDVQSFKEKIDEILERDTNLTTNSASKDNGVIHLMQLLTDLARDKQRNTSKLYLTVSTHNDTLSSMTDSMGGGGTTTKPPPNSVLMKISPSSLINPNAIGLAERTKSLLATSDSVEMLTTTTHTGVEKKTTITPTTVAATPNENEKDEDDTITEFVCPRERRISVKQELFADSNYTPDFARYTGAPLPSGGGKEAAVRPSKLLLHHDSVELLRSTMSVHTTKLHKTSESPPTLLRSSNKVRQSTVSFSPMMVEVMDDPEPIVSAVNGKKKNSHETGLTTINTSKPSPQSVRHPHQHNFVNDRMESLLVVIKNNPSLQYLFTTCLR